MHPAFEDGDRYNVVQCLVPLSVETFNEGMQIFCQETSSSTALPGHIEHVMPSVSCDQDSYSSTRQR